MGNASNSSYDPRRRNRYTRESPNRRVTAKDQRPRHGRRARVMWRAVFFGLLIVTPAAYAQTSAAHLTARAKSFELNTPYVPPPGDPLEHSASGFAKIMCSAVFVTGLDPEFAAETVGYFTSPYEER